MCVRPDARFCQAGLLARHPPNGSELLRGENAGYSWRRQRASGFVSSSCGDSRKTRRNPKRRNHGDSENGNRIRRSNFRRADVGWLFHLLLQLFQPSLTLAPSTRCAPEGFDVVAVQPVVAAVGAGEPHGKINTCHDVAGPTLVQPILTELEVNAEEVSVIGFGQRGAGAQVTLAAHPELVTLPSEVNTKVKQPEAVEAVN